MFKKMALILASACIMLSFAACGNKNNDTNSEPYQSKNQDSRSYSDNSDYNNNDGIINDTIDGIENDVKDGIDNVEEGIKNGMDTVNPSSSAR